MIKETENTKLYQEDGFLVTLQEACNWSVYVDCSDAMDIMSVLWNVVFMCSVNNQVQKSKLVYNSFSRIVKQSRTFWLMKVRTQHCLEMSVTDWHSVLNKKNEIFLSKALLYIVLIMCQASVCYTTDVVSGPYSDGASTFIWNVNQFFQIWFSLEDEKW